MSNANVWNGARKRIHEQPGHHVGQPVAPGDPVADFQHAADLAGVGLGAETAEFFAND